jgi:uncharacterized Rmd1/YagE family protein
VGGDGVCAAYCASSPLSLKSVARYFGHPRRVGTPAGGVFAAPAEPQLRAEASDVLRVPLRVIDGGADSCDAHAFFFRSGAVVFWGVPLATRRVLLQQTSIFAANVEAEAATGGGGGQSFGSSCVPGNGSANPPPASMVSIQHDSPRAALRSRTIHMEEFEHEFVFHVTGKKKNGRRAAFRNDEIYIGDLADCDEILALSYGLAQSVKLHVHEVALDALVQRTECLPLELAQYGRISLSATDIRKLIGELLAARYSVNLVSDILDTPEFFWQRPELERLYVECAAAVELKQRSRVLEVRAQVVNDALHILNSELASASSMRIERAILFLIAVEVVFEVVRFPGVLF